MTDEKRLNELKAKKKLTGAERAQIKVIERKINQAKKNTAPVSAVAKNVFATQPTTKISPLPIRFTNKERAGLTTIANDLKSNNRQLVIEELGGEREINDTKLVRAAIYLLKQHSDEEIIEAIKQVKLSMIR